MTTSVSNVPLPNIPVATRLIGGAVYQEMIKGIANVPHDEVVMSYGSDGLSEVIYKLLGVTQATLTLTYTSGNLTGVVRT